MRNILLWDKILKQLQSGAYGPAPTYARHSLIASAVGSFDLVDAPIASDLETFFGRPDFDPLADLEVSWTEAEHNLMLMADDGIITADFTAKAVSNVRLTDKGRRTFELRNDGNRLSSPISHLSIRTSTAFNRLAFPLAASAVVLWFVLDAL
ncbi:MAG: hypothetical protein AAFQ64_21090 [Pseudomonadota bacterium]